MFVLRGEEEGPGGGLSVKSIEGETELVQGESLVSIEHEMLKVASNRLAKDPERSGGLNRIWGLRGLEPAFPSPCLLCGHDLPDHPR